MSIIETCGDWIENKQLIRRLVLLWSIAMTTSIIVWALDFAQHSVRPGSDVAAILGVILGPLSLLQGWALSMYNAARQQ